jgi:hypothetical protein
VIAVATLARHVAIVAIACTRRVAMIAVACTRRVAMIAVACTRRIAMIAVIAIATCTRRVVSGSFICALYNYNKIPKLLLL